MSILDLTCQPWWAIYAKNSAFFTETLYFSITIQSYFNASLAEFTSVLWLCFWSLFDFAHSLIFISCHCITNVALKYLDHVGLSSSLFFTYYIPNININTYFAHYIYLFFIYILRFFSFLLYILVSFFLELLYHY